MGLICVAACDVWCSIGCFDACALGLVCFVIRLLTALVLLFYWFGFDVFGCLCVCIRLGVWVYCAPGVLDCVICAVLRLVEFGFFKLLF